MNYIKSITSCRILFSIAALYISGIPAASYGQENSAVTYAETYPTELTTAHIGDYLRIDAQSLDSLLNTDEKKNGKLTLYLNDVPMHGIYPNYISRNKNFVIFNISRDSISEKAWNMFYRYPRKYSMEVPVSIGNEFTGPLPSYSSEPVEIEIIFIRKYFYIGSLVCLAVLLLFFIWMANKSNIIKDQSDAIKKPYSLARVQFAFWTLLIVSSFVYIWAVTGELSPLIGSTWVLLAVSIGTSGGAKIIDFSQNEKRRHQNQESEGWIIDILSDENGVSIHRFQMFIWTIVLGVVFVRDVILNLSMPQFDDSLLVLMGISNGTYLGLKVPENSSVTPTAPTAPAPQTPVG